MISRQMMRNKYSSHLQKEQQIRSSVTFLPMLCSSAAAKQVQVPSSRRRSSSSLDEPSSPRVGCMGQVKRTSKVVAFPATLLFKQSDIQNCSTFHNSGIGKYHKLKRFFSPKSLASSPTTTTAARATTVGTHKARITSGKDVTVRSNRVRSETGTVDHHHHQHQHGRILVCRSRKMNNEKTSTDKGSLVNLEELDPPLPVLKRPPLQKQQQREQGIKEENISLWKRRSGGAPLKTLEVQVVNQNHTLLPANTV